MIKYLGNEKYGIWSTLLSIISWITLFDIGIGNGLRNKVSEAMAKNRIDDAQKYITAAYISIGGIVLVMLSVFFLASHFISWQSFFNTTSVSNDELSIVLNISVGFLFINFWLSLINQIFNGMQKSSLVVLNQFLSSFFALCAVYFLYSFEESSLVKLTFVYGFSLVVTNMILSIWFFKQNYNLFPKLSLFSKLYTSTIFSLGYKFFIIQIAAIIIFTTDKMLIAQLFGPQSVASYDVVFKLFSIITVIHSLILGPLWSAYSDAFHREEYLWISKTIQKQLKIALVLAFISVALIFLSQAIIDVWIGNDLHVDNKLVVSMGIYSIILVFGNTITFVLNGTNKLNAQVLTSIIAIVINIPLAIFIVKYFHTDVYGVVVATNITMLVSVMIVSIDVYKTVITKVKQIK
jgi:O-antigen/teichoic acid export membrane protein